MNSSNLRRLIFSVVGAVFCALTYNSLGAVMDAALSPGNPVTIGSPTQFSGVGGTNTAGGAFTALQAFQTAIGGVNNGGNPPPQASGFRVINWDAVALDGTDF